MPQGYPKLTLETQLQERAASRAFGQEVRSRFALDLVFHGIT